MEVIWVSDLEAGKSKAWPQRLAGAFLLHRDLVRCITRPDRASVCELSSLPLHRKVLVSSSGGPSEPYLIPVTTKGSISKHHRYMKVGITFQREFPRGHSNQGRRESQRRWSQTHPDTRAPVINSASWGLSVPSMQKSWYTEKHRLVDGFLITWNSGEKMRSS